MLVVVVKVEHRTLEEGQERVVPKPQPHQATGAAGAGPTVAPSPAHHGARKAHIVRGDGS